MQFFIVVDNPADWPLDLPGIDVIAARTYITDSRYNSLRNVKVFNLCKSLRYQSTGYYASLLAAARGHKPLPNVQTIQDLKSQSMIRFVSEELDELMQESFKGNSSDKIILNIYFGRNSNKKYDRLCDQLFKQFPTPFLRAQFQCNNQSWVLQGVSPLTTCEVSNEDHPLIVEAAQSYFNGKKNGSPKKLASRYDLAILYNPKEEYAPSNDKAMQKFIKAAESIGLNPEIIHKEDYRRIAEFDALFIRETTSVNHHTYRFARRAAAEGLVVMDDPESILKCTNKVYLAELLERHNIPAPKTIILHRDNIERVIEELGFPCVLKQPDSAFSQGVIKVNDAEELIKKAQELLEKSELLIAQEFIPTPFDWRVGIIDRQPLFVCKYYMARHHWQIYEKSSSGKLHSGRSDTLAVGQAPKHVVRAALKAANLIGDGFYGVDLKETENGCYIIEVNDNPSIDTSVEDLVLHDELYLKIMQVFLKRIEEKKKGR